jgi:hypothetical protein
VRHPAPRFPLLRRDRCQTVRLRASPWFKFHDEFLGVVGMIDANRIVIEEFALNSCTSRIQFFYARLFDGFL